MQITKENILIFHHLIALPNANCVYCSTRESLTGKARLFLVFNDRKRIYYRNGAKGTWEELKDQETCETVKEGFRQTIEKRSIPCYRVLN